VSDLRRYIEEIAAAKPTDTIGHPSHFGLEWDADPNYGMLCVFLARYILEKEAEDARS
jgi:hypothetical protein